MDTMISGAEAVRTGRGVLRGADREHAHEAGKHHQREDAPLVPELGAPPLSCKRHHAQEAQGDQRQGQGRHADELDRGLRKGREQLGVPPCPELFHTVWIDRGQVHGKRPLQRRDHGLPKPPRRGWLRQVVCILQVLNAWCVGPLCLPPAPRQALMRVLLWNTVHAAAPAVFAAARVLRTSGSAWKNAAGTRVSGLMDDNLTTHVVPMIVLVHSLRCCLMLGMTLQSLRL
mmetsp:Transcript_117628/g.344433  ORF Transcript_117628/g.344433 Transcript_117628/m.344433 type:complete len:230 (+) Transcript_117628:956-1645(+)